MNLIGKEDAPRCCRCNRILWRIHWDERAKRAQLGYIPNHRETPNGIACFNTVQCEKRKERT